MRYLLVLAALCCSVGIVSAQTLGSLTGEVKDPSGALAPNVTVTLKNVGTNGTRTNVTNQSGIYNFPDLEPADYQVSVAATGFETISSTFTLQVQQHSRLDFTLVVGQATQTIEVSANAAQLNTEDATVGTVIEEKRITDLPLATRSFFQLVQLSPNVNTNFTAPAQASGREGGSRAGVTISMAGTGRRGPITLSTASPTSTSTLISTLFCHPSTSSRNSSRRAASIPPSSDAKPDRSTFPPNPAPIICMARYSTFCATSIWMRGAATSFCPLPPRTPTSTTIRLCRRRPCLDSQNLPRQKQAFLGDQLGGAEDQTGQFQHQHFLTAAMRNGDFSQFGCLSIIPIRAFVRRGASSTCPISTPTQTVAGTGTQTYTAVRSPTTRFPPA